MNIDATLTNADWPKRTPDKFSDLGVIVQKFQETQHPRDTRGRFTESASITVTGRQIEVVKPERAIRAGDKLVPLNVLAFDQEFQKEPGFYLGVGGQGGIGTRYTRFGEFLSQHDSIEAAEVSVHSDGRIGFTNGRHRYAWLRDQGLTSIPVAMTPESVRNAKKFGYLAAVKLAWDESDHPRDKEGQFTTFYHGTLQEQLDSIKEQGLQTNRSGLAWPGLSQPGTIYLGRTKEAAMGWAESTTLRLEWKFENPTAVVLEVRVPDDVLAKSQRTAEPEGNLRVFQDIPPEWIVGVTVGRSHDQILGVTRARMRREEAKHIVPPVITKSETFYVGLVIEGGRVQKWDESQHPRDEKGQFSDAGRSVGDYVHSSEPLTTEEEDRFTEFEEAWAGGVADFGDAMAATYVQQLPKYNAYRTKLVAELEQNYGPKITVYRAVSQEALEEMEAGTWQGPIATTTNPELAKKWVNFARNKNTTLHILKTTISPKLAVIRGKAEESEIVIDGDWVSFHEWEHVGTAKKRQWEESKHPRQGGGSSHGGEFVEALHSPGDALFSLLNNENATIDRGDVRTLLEKAAELEDTEDPNLLHLHVDGMDVFDKTGLGIKREHMPQIPRAHRAQFMKEMKDIGVEIVKEWVDPLTLKPTQDEISARNAGQKMREYEKKKDKAFPPLLVSKEGRLLDGHHHWAMMAGLAVDAPGVKVPIYRLRISTKRALALMHAYDKKYKIERKALGQKWDESRHSRDQEGQFTESGAPPKPSKRGYHDITPERHKRYHVYDENDNLVDKTYDSDEAQRWADQRNGYVEDIGEEKPKKKTAKKADPATGRYVTPFVSFEKQGDESLRMIASLNSSRLATWGFTAEAEVLGMARYRLTAVLDGRTSNFCRMVDGKVFEVQDARRKVIEVLNVQNPEDLRTVQPWPKQDRASMAEFRQMDPEELTQLGLHIPPYHPHCRTLLRHVPSSVGEPTEPVPTIPVEAEVFQPVTADDLRELGVEATPEDVALWNAHIGMTPAELLSKLSGMPPQEVMTKGKGVGANPIRFDEAGNIGFNVRGATPQGLEFKLNALLDPFTSTYYLTQADLIAGNPKAELAFLKNLFGSLIEMGLKSSATSVAVGVAGSTIPYAKMGFLPDELEWDSLRTYALNEIDTGALKPILDSLAPADQQLVIHLLQDRSVGAMSALVELPFTYEGKTIGEWLFGEATGTWALDLTDDLMVAQAKEYLT